MLEGEYIRAWLFSANTLLESDVSPFVSKFMTLFVFFGGSFEKF
jgi:hypothetical protein